MKIKILGNGGAINDGLPYNAFIIDNTVLVEAPPDIMLSLHREQAAMDRIEQIFISHLHGDHCFGFPFLALHLFFKSITAGYNNRLTMFLPESGKDFLFRLTGNALGDMHPCIGWISQNIDFVPLRAGAEISLSRYTARLYPMDHLVETYGFILNSGGEDIFAYIADTRWSPEIETMLSHGPRAILLDLNGEPDDPVRVHLSEAELIEKGVPLVNKHCRFYGTHLKSQKTRRHDAIDYAYPGMEIEIGQ